MPPPESPLERGAQNLAERCLCVRAGETVHVATFHVDEDIVAPVLRALERAGGRVVRSALEALDPQGDASRAESEMTRRIGAATASLFMGGATAPAAMEQARALSFGTMRAVRALGVRHIHMVQIDARAMGQSVRADPDMLATVNQRLVERLRPPARVHVTSAAGTDVIVTLAPEYRFVSATGRPEQGKMDNLPSGFVFTHPASVDGVYVADRGIASATFVAEGAALRRSPARVELAGGRVTRVECGVPGVVAALEAFMSQHANAARVGTVTLPTNYLVRSEIGHDLQDALLPGLRLGLGHTARADTGASYDVPYQTRLTGRRQSVEVGGRPIVDAGRFEQSIVEGTDPFR